MNLRSEARVGALRIDVVDNGPGIPAEDLPLVFDRFYQVGDRRARKKGGSGLGLSIARSIVQAHGGSLVADSALGRGTTMTIVLPLCPHPEPLPAAASEVTASVPRAERAGTGLRARLQAGGAATAASRQ